MGSTVYDLIACRKAQVLGSERVTINLMKQNISL